MKALPDAWYKAVVWLAYTCLGVIPVGIGAFVVGAVSGVKLGDLTDGGQFAVYSAAVLAGTFYVVAKPARLRLPFTEWFSWFAFAGVLVAGVLFTLATLCSSGGEIGENIDRDFFRWPSIGLSIASLGVAFIAVGLDEGRMEKMESDVLQQPKRDEEHLRNEFRGTEGSRGESR